MRRSGFAGVLPMAVALIAAACTGGAPPSDAAATGGPQALAATSPPASAPATQASSQEPTSALPTPTPTPGPLPSGLAPDIVAAIAWRRENGLRSDPEWVARVGTDPTASVSWAYPITPAEEAFIWARQEKLQPYVGLVQRHAAEYPDEFGGLFMDNANSQVASLWTRDLEGHLAALRELAGSDAPIAVLPARWPEAHLRAVQDRISRDWDWFAEVEAEAQGVGADLKRNVVTIDISSANPDAPHLIAERISADLGVPIAMLEVVSDGTGVALLPFGTVKGVVVMADGSKPGENDLSVDGRPDTIGSCGGGDIGYGVGATGWFEIPCRIGTYTIVIMGTGPDGNNRVVGQGRVTVREDQVTKVRIRLEPGSDIRG